MSFKICVVCCGGIAFHQHGHGYKRYAALHADTDLAACCDIDEKKARDFQVQFGFRKYYTDFKLMFKEEKPDAVCLNAPEELTASLAAEILRMGYPLILEKPPGLNPAETNSILAAANEGKVLHQVAFNRHFMPVVKTLVRDLRENFKPGDIQYIGCDFFRCNRKDADFYTTAIHGIDTVRYIAGVDYKELSFLYQEMPDAARGSANFYIHGTVSSGACVQLRFCPMTGARFERITVNLRGSTYMALLPHGDSIDSPGRLFHYQEDKLVKEITSEEIDGSRERFMTNGFYQEDAAFFDTVKAGRQLDENLQYALQSVEIADCLQRRAEKYLQ